MAVSFLELPTELLIRIFCDLNSPDLVSCQLTHSSLCAIISESVRLSYIKALQFAGVEDNPHSKLTISERLSLLKAQENAWLNLHIDFRKTITVNHHSSGIYDLTGGIYLLGNRNRRALHYLTLPTKSSDATTWTKIDVGRDLIDVALAIHEHDLIAIITTTPQEGRALHFIELVLLKFSTGQPHPLARNASIFIAEMDPGPRPAISMEIAGDNLALIIKSWSHLHPDDQLYVYNWRTGVLKMETIAPGGSFYGLVFLTPQLLLLPNTAENILEFWNIPSTSDTAPARPIRALGLPAPRDGHYLSILACRGEPNPFGSGLPYSTLPFHSSSMEAIVVFNLRVESLDMAPHDTFSMFVHRRALVALCPDATTSQPDDDTDLDIIPWDRWGPSVTRWVGTGVMPTRWITTTAGQRCALRFGRDEDHPSPIVILDFNPTSLKRAAAGNNSPRRTYVTKSTRLVHRSFEAPIVSALPYARYTSPGVFRYEGLLMDEERLIGLRTNEMDRITSIEVLHLGPGF